MKSKELFLNNETELQEARVLSDAQLIKSGARYKMDKNCGMVLEVTDQQINDIQRQIEDLLSNKIINPDILNRGQLDISIAKQDEIGYEFELEEEQRIMVELRQEIEKWQNHIIDVYDQSGRCRIREKNGSFRLSLKVPLFSRDTNFSKCCIRLEFKPVTKQQSEDLLKIRELILQEPGTQIYEKWGTPLINGNGQKVWINKDGKGSCWIETDETAEITGLLPDGIKYLSHKKSSVTPVARKIDSRIDYDKLIMTETVASRSKDFKTFAAVYSDNLGKTSRTSKGKVDTSVSGKKEKSGLSGEDLIRQVRSNADEVLQFIWENKSRSIESPEHIKNIINEIVRKVNYKISRSPDALRTWDWRELPPEKVKSALFGFCQELFEKVMKADSGEISPVDLACWIELRFDREIHAYADGCGRISKALSAFFLGRYGYPLPKYGSRSEYYGAMNKGAKEFKTYYSKAFMSSINNNYL